MKNDMFNLYRELLNTGDMCLARKAELLLPVALYGRKLTKQRRECMRMLMTTLLTMNLNEKCKLLVTEIREAI